jgi:hypothetical protein
MDWEISPNSFSSLPAFASGDGACAAVALPPRIERSFHFFKILVDPPSMEGKDGPIRRTDNVTSEESLRHSEKRDRAIDEAVGATHCCPVN